MTPPTNALATQPGAKLGCPHSGHGGITTELTDCKAAFKTIKSEAEECCGDVLRLYNSIKHHRELLEAYSRGLGEAMQAIRSGKGVPRDAEDIQKLAKGSMAALER